MVKVIDRNTLRDMRRGESVVYHTTNPKRNTYCGDPIVRDTVYAEYQAGYGCPVQKKLYVDYYTEGKPVHIFEYVYVRGSKR